MSYLRGLLYRIGCVLSLPLTLTLLIPLIMIIDVVKWVLIGNDDWWWMLVIDWYEENILYKMLG